MPMNRSPRHVFPLCGDRFDAERHEELQLVARLVLFHAADNGGFRALRLRPIRRAYGLDEGLDVAALPVPHFRDDGSPWPM